MTPQEMKEAIYSAFEPPVPMRLSEWADANIVLPEPKARPGRYRTWPYMVEILDTFTDPEIERVTVIKSARIGFTKGLMIAMGAVSVTDPVADHPFGPDRRRCAAFCGRRGRADVRDDAGVAERAPEGPL